MRRVFTVLSLAMLLVVGLLAPAVAGGHDASDEEIAESTIYWDEDERGDENLPCEGNEHWILAKPGVTSATLTIDGTEPVTMKQMGTDGAEGALHAWTDVGFDGTQDVSVTYMHTGDADALLTLSDCEGAGDVLPDVPVTVEFAKVWTGDDRGDAEAVSVTVDDGIGVVAFGVSVDVTDWQGETLTWSEQVSGLADDCGYTADVTGFTVPSVEELDDTHITITITNDVDCADVEGVRTERPDDDEDTVTRDADDEDTVTRDADTEVLGVTVEFAKAWTGDDRGDAEAVSVTVDDGIGVVAFGESVDVTDWQGETLTWTEEVSGLADDCGYTADVTDFTVPYLEDLDDTHNTITITNDVDCADVEGVRIERPDDDEVTVIRDTDTEVLGVIRDTDTEVLGVTVESLPRTGLNAWVLLLIGAGLIGSGGSVVGAARRRR